MDNDDGVMRLFTALGGIKAGMQSEAVGGGLGQHLVGECVELGQRGIVPFDEIEPERGEGRRVMRGRGDGRRMAKLMR